MSDTQVSVLIIDDEEDIAVICAETFESEGLNADYALRADTAISMLREKHYDVIISDIIMPGMSGIELLDTIHKQFDHEYLFYFITGSVGITEGEVLDRGATGLISKPYDLDELVLKVKHGVRSILKR